MKEAIRAIPLIFHIKSGIKIEDLTEDHLQNIVDAYLDENFSGLEFYETIDNKSVEKFDGKEKNKRKALKA